MSNLSKRVEKAKGLNFSHNPHDPGRYSTWGSKDSDYGQKYYRISLSHTTEEIVISNPDHEKRINTSVLLVDCQKDVNGIETCNCPGNERHTVCYHGLGAIYQSFKSKDKLVAFFETYESAKQMAFGGKIAKVKSVNGGGYLWCVVRDWPKKNDEIHEPYPTTQILSVQHNVNLMRGSESDEGID